MDILGIESACSVTLDGADSGAGSVPRHRPWPSTGFPRSKEAPEMVCHMVMMGRKSSLVLKV